MSLSTVIVLAILALVILTIIVIYNRLVTLKNRFQNGFSQIEVQLKRRHDLIPNLVETAKGYLKHEQTTLIEVVNARNSAQSELDKLANNPSDHNMTNLGKAESLLSGALGKLNLVIENYPDLKASENMQRLHEELLSTENKVAFARQAYNDFVTEYNTYKQTFPPNLIASFLGHQKDAALLEFEDSAKIQSVPNVAF